MIPTRNFVTKNFRLNIIKYGFARNIKILFTNSFHQGIKYSFCDFSIFPNFPSPFFPTFLLRFSPVKNSPN